MTSIRLLTWNLNGLDDDHLDERTEAAVFTSILGARLDELRGNAKPTPPPDVLVFQEVVKRTFLAHITPHVAAGGYRLLPDTSPERQTFEVIAFRDNLDLRAYQSAPLRGSIYGRQLHTADFDVDGAALRVLTGHFDSGTDAGTIRRAQLLQVNGVIGDAGVFAGDTNLRKAEWESAKDDVVMADAWERLGSPAASRITWRKDEYRARFDRVFVGRTLHPKSMSTVGIGSLPGLDVPISDHVGLLVELQFQPGAS